MAAEYIESTLYGGKVKVKFYPNSHQYWVDTGNGYKRARGVTTHIGIKDKSVPLVAWATETAGLHLYDIIARGEAITLDDVKVAINKHRDIKDEAALIGEAMHKWCEYFIKHKLNKPGYETKPEMPQDPQIKLGVESFLEWYLAHNVQFISSERFLYSLKHGYMGLMDFEAIVDGKLTAGDFKSSNGLYNSVLMQMSAYIEAAEEEAAYIGKPVKYENRVAVRLAKETEDEYNLRMERKGLLKAKSEYEPYKPFEWKVFEGRETHERDLKAFINAKELFEWDSATDFYKNK